MWYIWFKGSPVTSMILGTIFIIIYGIAIYSTLEQRQRVIDNILAQSGKIKSYYVNV